jgi:hypothetical protein
MNPQPQVGDLVDIVVKGVRVTSITTGAATEYGPGVFVAIPAANGCCETSVMVRPESPAVTVTVIEPAVSAEWPPRLGDLWRDKDGDLWFATTAHRYSHGPGDMPAVAVVELVHAGGGPSRLPDEVNREYGPFTLVRREDTADPASPVEGVWPPRVGEVWRDSENDDWTAFDTPDGVMLRMGVDGVRYTVQEVPERYGPLTFVRHEQAEASR